MKINKETLICGIPIIKIRDLIRKIDSHTPYVLEIITGALHLTEQQSLSLLNELINLGYLEKEGEDKYARTVKGNALAQVKFVSRMNKTFSSLIEELSSTEYLVLKRLKNRSPYISLHRIEELDELKADYKQIFP